MIYLAVRIKMLLPGLRFSLVNSCHGLPLVLGKFARKGRNFEIGRLNGRFKGSDLGV